MKYHNGRPFSTKDKDPDTLSIHCAKAYMGGWWYKNCYKANLNGLYASYSDNKVVHQQIAFLYSIILSFKYNVKSTKL